MVMKRCKGFMLDKPKMKSVYKEEGDDSRRVVVLNSLVENTQNQLLGNDLPDTALSLLRENDDFKVTVHEMTTTYADLTVEQVLKSVIPSSESVDVPCSFETVGHIAHVNLRENVLPWKYVVGKVRRRIFLSLGGEGRGVLYDGRAPRSLFLFHNTLTYRRHRTNCS